MNSYLSRIRVRSVDHVGVMPILKADNYRLHQILWNLFPENPHAKRDFLFRRDATKTWPLFYLLSDRKPESEHHALVIESKPFAPRLHPGQRLAFSLYANPVKTIKDENGRTNRLGEAKKCRVPLRGEDQQRRWLARKLSGAASVNTLIVCNNQPIYFRKKSAVGKIVPVTFEGVLTVDDSATLLQRIRQGIGPAKAFGCGLLLVRRA